MYILIMCLAIVTSTLNSFLYCSFGKSASDNIASFSDQLYNADWPGIPNNSQKSLILMIMNTQQAPAYHGFEMVTLNLETFTKVTNDHSLTRYTYLLPTDYQVTINGILMLSGD